MEIVVAQLNSEKVEIENCDQSRQAMPWDKEVDEMKNSDEDTLEQRGFEVGRVHHDGSCRWKLFFVLQEYAMMIKKRAWT